MNLKRIIPYLYINIGLLLSSLFTLSYTKLGSTLIYYSILPSLSVSNSGATFSMIIVFLLIAFQIVVSATMLRSKKHNKSSKFFIFMLALSYMFLILAVELMARYVYGSTTSIIIGLIQYYLIIGGIFMPLFYRENSYNRILTFIKPLTQHLTLWDYSFSIGATWLISSMAYPFILSLYLWTSSTFIVILLLIIFSMYDLFAVFVFPLKQLVAQKGDKGESEFRDKILKITTINIGAGRLGLGDILFYGILISVTYILTMSCIHVLLVAIGINIGFVITDLIRIRTNHALPALPASIFIGLLFLFFV